MKIKFKNTKTHKISNSEHIIYFPQFVDEYGNEVERNKYDYPYAYSPYVVYDNRNNIEELKDLHVVYSDRLLQWNYAKYNKCHKEIFGDEAQMFFDNDPKDIEKFLKLYLEKPNLELRLIMNGANMSSGYPYWIFFFKPNNE